MGVCLPEQKKGQIIASNADKNLLIFKDDPGTNSTGIYGSKKSSLISNLKNNKYNNRLSSKTIYDDINKYYKINPHPFARGGTSSIYEATKIKDNEQTKNKKYMPANYDPNMKYAIKKIKKNKNTDKFNKDISKEIEINLLIKNENIVKCFEIYESKDEIYFVEEKMEGGDLFDYITTQPNGKLAEKDAIKIFEQILKSLLYLHYDLRITHRDIKPENFLIVKPTANINNIKIKLIDFGTSDFNNPQGFTKAEKGTALYVAPEIFLRVPYNFKVDIWAAGIILFNMVTGSHPYNNLNNEKKLIQEIVNGKIDFQQFKEPALRKFAMELLEKDPEKRLSAKEALYDLEKVKKIFSENPEENVFCRLATITSYSPLRSRTIKEYVPHDKNEGIFETKMIRDIADDDDDDHEDDKNQDDDKGVDTSKIKISIKKK